MLNWVAKVFRRWFEVVLWLILIVFIVAGGIIGGAFGRYFRSVGAIFSGALIEIIVGLIFVVISGGLIANFLNLVDDLELLRKKFCGASLTEKTLEEQSFLVNEEV